MYFQVQPVAVSFFDHFQEETLWPADVLEGEVWGEMYQQGYVDKLCNYVLWEYNRM